MNKQEVYALLQAKQLHFEITEHPAVYTMAELADVPCPYPDADAKNLFIRDNKKQHYYLLTVQGNKRVDLKAFRKAQQTRPLTFASSEELLDKLRLPPGAVTPLGLLNRDVHEVTAYFDEELLTGSGLVGVHPNENTATVWLKTADLIQLLREHGCEVIVTRL